MTHASEFIRIHGHENKTGKLDNNNWPPLEWKPVSEDRLKFITKAVRAKDAMVLATNVNSNLSRHVHQQAKNQKNVLVGYAPEKEGEKRACTCK
jgi:hypothetical protein